MGVLDFFYDNTDIRLINIYAQNDGKIRKPFFEKKSKYCNRKTIIVGDFNVK